MYTIRFYVKNPEEYLDENGNFDSKQLAILSTKLNSIIPGRIFDMAGIDRITNKKAIMVDIEYDNNKDKIEFIPDSNEIIVDINNKEARDKTIIGLFESGYTIKRLSVQLNKDGKIEKEEISYWL